MNLHNDIMNIPCKRTDEEFSSPLHRLTYKEGHRDARHAAAELANAHEAAQQAHDKEILRAQNEESLSIILWLLRRLPRCYGLPPHIEPEILRLSKLTGIDCSDVLNERMSK